MTSKWVRLALIALTGVAGILCLDLAGVDAQTIPNASVQSVLQSLGQTSPTTTSPLSTGMPAPAGPIVVPPNVSTTTQTLLPAVPPTQAQLPPSTLELVFSQRSGQPLQQFGYDIFGIGQQVASSQIGNVQDTYILGTGDQLSIVNRGHDNNSYVVPVDRDGRVIVPGYDPVQAAGRTFVDVRRDLQRVIAHDALQTQSYISLAQTRQINVLVSGEVNAPGVRVLSGLNTPVDALLLSGGIRKTGSLRAIVLVRGSRRISIDLYSVLARGSLASVGGLTDGDHIIVPPIGSTAAVIGLVNRPGIYELTPGARAIDGRALIRLAGGAYAGANHLSRIELESTGRLHFTSLGHDGTIRGGEIITVDQETGGSVGRVTLAGAVQLPGFRTLSEASSLSKLLHDPRDVTPGAYAPFAIVVHHEPGSGAKHAIAVSLTKIFNHEDDFKLADDDVVFVLTNSQASALAAAAAAQLQAAAQAGSVPPSVITQALQASSAQSAATTASAVPSVAGTPAPAAAPPPVNNAATIYASANGGTTTATPPPAGGTPSAAPAVAGTTPALPSLSQALSATPPPGTTAATAPPPVPPQPMIGVLPQPQAAPYDARTAAAGSRQPYAATALLQAQGAQSASTGQPIQGGGLTTPPALGSPLPDTNPTDIATELGLDPPSLINLASDYMVTIVGDVHDPGPYLAVGGTTLGAMLDVAGGLEVQADLSWVEVTSTDIDASSGTSHTLRNAYKGRSRADFDQVVLRPLDTIRVRQVFADRESGTVTIVGQVKYPGSFDILRNERLSSLINRAGGITDEAYPYGAVYTRISAQQAEAEGNYREAVELQSGALIAATTPNVNPGILTYLQQLQTQLLHQPALGRISVEADPTILSVKPQLDTLLQPGDFVYIPKRPGTVSVSGEVLNPGSFQYKPGMSLNDYLDMAGGATQTAETDSTFIILPDGSARPASSDFFDFLGNDPIPPGSTIVVPPDPAPFNTLVFLTSASQIFSQLAVALASLSVISERSN
ncbi:MAG: SLBB domain-containing protein [Rhizomicrobium sp.]|jgi:protein involved in polysaccharide export with SLBB domain